MFSISRFVRTFFAVFVQFVKTQPTVPAFFNIFPFLLNIYIIFLIFRKFM